ncbi:MAG: HAMP domain-containing sensor histidine kinase [Anaerolineae bacterium]
MAYTLTPKPNMLELNPHDVLTMFWQRPESERDIQITQKALTAAQTEGSEYTLALIKCHLAVLYSAAENQPDAITLLEEALPSLQQHGDEVTEMGTHQQLAELYKNQQDYASALRHHEAFHELYAASTAVSQTTLHQRLHALQTLVSGMYHDLMTPISIIKTTLYLLSKLQSDTEKLSQRQQIMQFAVDNLIGKIRKMALMAKLDGMSADRFNPGSACLDEVLKVAIESLPPELKPIERVQITNKTPGLELTADTYLLSSALTELLDNSLRYSAGSEAVQVKIRSINNKLTINIKDHGTGITTDDLPNLFERNTQKGSKTNLGLPIAHMIIEKHGGCIRIESNPDYGSTFKITLPLNQVAVLQSEAIPA